MFREKKKKKTGLGEENTKSTLRTFDSRTKKLRNSDSARVSACVLWMGQIKNKIEKDFDL